MKQDLSTYQVADMLCNDDNANWSRLGAFALAEHIEQVEADCGEQWDIDVVGIRCDYSEYSSLVEWAGEYFGADNMPTELTVGDCADADEQADAIREYIRERGSLIEFDGGVIISAF